MQKLALTVMIDLLVMSQVPLVHRLDGGAEPGERRSSCALPATVFVDPLVPRVPFGR
jgi:hypothetical protein